MCRVLFKRILSPDIIHEGFTALVLTNTAVHGIGLTILFSLRTERTIPGTHHLRYADELACHYIVQNRGYELRRGERRFK